jgi:hypothetical protein
MTNLLAASPELNPHNFGSRFCTENVNTVTNTVDPSVQHAGYRFCCVGLATLTEYDRWRKRCVIEFLPPGKGWGALLRSAPR